MAATGDTDDEDLLGTPGLERSGKETINKTACCVASIVVENVDGQVVPVCDDCGRLDPVAKRYDVDELQTPHER